MTVNLYLSDNIERDLVKILQQVVKNDLRCLVIFANNDEKEYFSKKLWSARAFIPHTDTVDEFIDDQFIFVHSSEDDNITNPIKANMCLCVNKFIKLNDLNIEKKLFLINELKTEDLDALNSEYSAINKYKYNYGKWQKL